MDILRGLRNDGISIHAPAKGATLATLISDGDPSGFQSTLPRRERRTHTIQFSSPVAISIHAPAKGATAFIANETISLVISIHAPAKGATEIRKAIDELETISIHAPAKGATSTNMLFYDWLRISIHAPAKGATSEDAFSVSRMDDFNPRSREGGDK